MNFLKTIAAVSAIAFSSFSVNAEQLTVGGITWNSSYVDDADALFSDFFAHASYTEVLATSGELSGSGNIGTVNGTNSGDFCVVDGCSLTYSFEGFNVSNTNIVTTAASSPATLDFTVTEANGDTNLWLSLVARENTSTYASTLFGTETITAFTAFFDVVEVAGTAWRNFDTDLLAGGTDFEVVASQFNLHTTVFKSTSVPAPTTLAIFGLGLLGLAARRRKA